MAIKWGSKVNDKGRIGLEVTTSNTSTVTTVTVAIWFWSKYSVNDSKNTLYFNDNKKNATTNKGAISVTTTDASGSGWSTSNQKRIKTYTFKVNRDTSAKTRNCAAKLTGIEAVGSGMTVTTSYTVPALTKYTITYNANGGTDAPNATTGYEGKTVTLRTAEPERSGYEFLGWAKTSSATTAKYQPGASLKLTGNMTLYAVWVKNVYKIVYKNNFSAISGYPKDAELPETQTKTKGVTLTLSSITPTGHGYTFSHWVDSDGNKYYPSGSYTADANLTLFAVWNRWTGTIKFNANGGTSAPSNIPYYYGTRTILNATPAYGNNIFKYWSTSADDADDSIHISKGGTFNYDDYMTANGQDVTLYAIWTICDVSIYDSGEIEAIEFIEGDKYYVNNKGVVCYKEFIECEETFDSDGNINPTNCQFYKNYISTTELIEK